MIGGVIIDVSPRSANRTCLWCAALLYDDYGTPTGIGEECGVHVASDGEIPSVGDTVWWECATVYWTPTDQRFIDRPLRKIGYSCSSAEMMTGMRSAS